MSALLPLPKGWKYNPVPTEGYYSVYDRRGMLRCRVVAESIGLSDPLAVGDTVIVGGDTGRIVLIDGHDAWVKRSDGRNLTYEVRTLKRVAS